MPVSRQKKCSTPNASGSTEGQSAPPLPEQQQFQQHLRELARRRTELTMRYRGEFADNWQYGILQELS